MSPGVTFAELASGDGPYVDAARLFCEAGSCDHCGSTLQISDLDAGDALCSRCRIGSLLNAWLYAELS